MLKRLPSQPPHHHIHGQTRSLRVPGRISGAGNHRRQRIQKLLMFRLLDDFVRQRSFTRFAHVLAELVHNWTHTLRRLSSLARCLRCRDGGRNNRGCECQAASSSRLRGSDCPRRSLPAYLVFAMYHVRYLLRHFAIERICTRLSGQSGTQPCNPSYVINRIKCLKTVLILF